MASNTGASHPPQAGSRELPILIVDDSDSDSDSDVQPPAKRSKSNSGEAKMNKVEGEAVMPKAVDPEVCRDMHSVSRGASLTNNKTERQNQILDNVLQRLGQDKMEQVEMDSEDTMKKMRVEARKRVVKLLGVRGV